MSRKLFFTILASFFTILVNAQVNSLVVSNNLRLPKDSLEQVLLVKSIDSFLILSRQNGNENPFVLTAEKSETQILLNEIREMLDKSDGIDVRPYLMGIEPLSDKKSYLIQLAYMDRAEKQAAPKACFDFIAHRTASGFLFSSPLSRYTKDWKTKKDGYLTMHYQDATENIINQYMQYITEYDGRLGVDKRTEYYFCDDCESMAQLLQVSGIRYMADYNGYAWNSIFFVTDEKIIVIQSQRISRRQTIDPHDLFHFRADIAIPEGRNHSMVCGCAYVYGGSWRISWEDIQKMFKSRMVYDKNTNWLKLYFEGYNFGESQEEHLLVTQFINALIIEKVEKEQGFSAVMKLLASGNMCKDRDKFFSILEKVTGINEKNFNRKVGELVAKL